MILKPKLNDFKIIGFYLGKVILGLGLITIIPFLVALFFNEWEPAADFAIAFCFCFIAGLLLNYLCHTNEEMKWLHGMVVVSISWLVAMFFGAIPLYLSGHWFSFLDACFDSMSGFTTTGLTLAYDIDHLSFAHNMWRHLIMFVGGQGIIVVALSFFVKGTAGAFKIYVGEARDEKILPNVIQTARFIWLVSLVYLVLGTLTLGLVGFFEGMAPLKAFFHGMWIFMAAFDTGGFAPQSQNISFYHSLPFELITIVIMVLGAMNFKLHYTLWTGNKKEIYRDIEIITLFITISFAFILTAVGLAQLDVYPTTMAMFRKGFYQLISAHTGTGYTNIYARQFITEWGTLATVALITAMGLGGAVCSTTGGIKALRIGIIFKALCQDIKKLLSPESSLIIQKYHHIKGRILEDSQVRGASLIILAYLILYGLGTLAALLFGYPLTEALFESTSAAANVGLSSGITTPAMPVVLKIVYIIQMWMGRLEFLSIFALAGFLVSLIKGK